MVSLNFELQTMISLDWKLITLLTSHLKSSKSMHFWGLAPNCFFFTFSVISCDFLCFLIHIKAQFIVSSKFDSMITILWHGRKIITIYSSFYSKKGSRSISYAKWFTAYILASSPELNNTYLYTHSLRFTLSIESCSFFSWSFLCFLRQRLTNALTIWQIWRFHGG